MNIDFLSTSLQQYLYLNHQIRTKQPNKHTENIQRVIEQSEFFRTSRQAFGGSKIEIIYLFCCSRYWQTWSKCKKPPKRRLYDDIINNGRMSVRRRRIHFLRRRIHHQFIRNYECTKRPVKIITGQFIKTYAIKEESPPFESCTTSVLISLNVDKLTWRRHSMTILYIYWKSTIRTHDSILIVHSFQWSNSNDYFYDRVRISLRFIILNFIKWNIPKFIVFTELLLYISIISIEFPSTSPADVRIQFFHKHTHTQNYYIKPFAHAPVASHQDALLSTSVSQTQRCNVQRSAASIEPFLTLLFSFRFALFAMAIHVVLASWSDDHTCPRNATRAYFLTDEICVHKG